MNQKGMKLWRIVKQASGLSRRKVQELIAVGELEVDGMVIQDPFIELNIENLQTLRLRGHPLSLVAVEKRVYRYYKPAGVLCSHDDPHSGNTLGRILRAEGFIGYTWAGRLDQDAEGLVLLTNDGNLVQRLTHPRYQVKKVYQVFVSRFPTIGELKRILNEMQRGIMDDGDVLRILSGEIKGRPLRVIVTVAEGRKHEVKRLFAHFNLTVTKLRRVAIGPVKLTGIAPGDIARLSPEDTAHLYRLASYPSGTEHMRRL